MKTKSTEVDVQLAYECPACGECYIFEYLAERCCGVKLTVKNVFVHKTTLEIIEFGEQMDSIEKCREFVKVMVDKLEGKE